MWIEHVIINDFVKQHHVFLVAMLTGCLAFFDRWSTCRQRGLHPQSCCHAATLSTGVELCQRQA
jgi:hypothetical protein